MKQRLPGKQSINVLAFSAIALPNAHFLGTFHQGRNDDQDIVQEGNQKQQRSDDRQQDDLCLHARIARMQFTERFQEILQYQAVGLKLLQRLMRLLHLPDSIGQRIRIHAREQLHIAPVPVITQPVCDAPFVVGDHRQQDIIVQRPVLREVLVDALDGKHQLRHFLVADLLADALPHSAHLLGERA